MNVDSLAASAPRPFAVPDELIERFLVDDVTSDERAAVRAAIEADAALRTYLAEREASRRAFLFEAPRLPQPKPRARVLSLRITAIAGAFAMVALFFIVARPHPEQIRVRGGPAASTSTSTLRVEVVVRRAAHVFALAPGVPLRPGDTVRIEVTAPADGFVSAVLVDARASAVVYEAVPVARGVTMLPDSLVLDDVTGAEALHVIFTRAPASSRALLDAVARDASTAGDARAVVEWHKEPGP